jgi:hypothetical protein
MTRALIVIVGVVASLSVARGTSAYTTHPIDLSTPSDSPADPDRLSDKMSNGTQPGGTTLGLPGGFRFQFSGPPSSNSTNSPFVTFPSTVFVPSEHR